MKRSLIIPEETDQSFEEIESIKMADYDPIGQDRQLSPERVFECKTCNRQFPSFQALGGHRASHKRAKHIDDHHGLDRPVHGCLKNFQKVHECSICGSEFNMGQALGGHMRRHRLELQRTGLVLSASGNKKSSINGVGRLHLDLNLPPLDNEGDILGLGLVGKVPTVH